jgi:hypothetical protein
MTQTLSQISSMYSFTTMSMTVSTWINHTCLGVWQRLFFKVFFFLKKYQNNNFIIII